MYGEGWGWGLENRTSNRLLEYWWQWRRGGGGVLTYETDKAQSSTSNVPMWRVKGKQRDRQTWGEGGGGGEGEAGDMLAAGLPSLWARITVTDGSCDCFVPTVNHVGQTYTVPQVISKKTAPSSSAASPLLFLPLPPLSLCLALCVSLSVCANISVRLFH